MPRETRASSLDTIVDDVVSYISSKDWDSAENSLLQAEAIIAITPDMNREASGLRYQREAISNLRKLLNSKRGAKITTLRVRHCRPTDGSDAIDSAEAATAFSEGPNAFIS